jgi:Uma2 family endonuclease
MLEVPTALLEERCRLGLDRADEMWEGTLHMVPPPLDGHEEINTELFIILAHRAQTRGLIARGGTPGLYGADNDWRVPDQLYALASQRRDDRFWGAELVVEIRSPGDESYEKMPFFAGVGVRECLIIDRRSRAAELYRLNAAGDYVLVDSGRSDVLDVTIVDDNGSLVVTIDGAVHRI